MEETDTYSLTLWYKVLRATTGTQMGRDKNSVKEVMGGDSMGTGM